MDEEKIGVILVDLSKAFDTLNHSLLLAKLDGYPEHLQIKQNYLRSRQQGSSINGSFSDRTEVITGVSAFCVRFCLIYFKMIFSCLFLNLTFAIMPMTTLCVLLEKT